MATAELQIKAGQTLAAEAKLHASLAAAGELEARVEVAERKLETEARDRDRERDALTREIAELRATVATARGGHEVDWVYPEAAVAADGAGLTSVDLRASVVSTAESQPFGDGNEGDGAGAGSPSTSVCRAKAEIDAITRERLPGDGASRQLQDALGRALDKLSMDIYDSDLHFLEEIIQNCDDCRYPEGTQPRLDVCVSGESVWMRWNESGFKLCDVVGVSDIGKSTKGENSIGQKGVGFKSCFAVSNNPRIVSNE